MGTCNCNCVGSNIVSAGNGVSGCLPKAYTPKATGTLVERDIRDRFADIVNVKDYGAKGDPQYDDTTAWNHFLSVESGVKYIPAGIYLTPPVAVIKRFQASVSLVFSSPTAP